MWISNSHTHSHTCTCKLSLTRRRCIIAWRARVPVVLVLGRRRVVSCLNMQSIVVAVCCVVDVVVVGNAKLYTAPKLSSVAA